MQGGFFESTIFGLVCALFSCVLNVAGDCRFPQMLQPSHASPNFRWITQIQHERDITGRASELHLVSRVEFEVINQGSEIVEYRRSQSCVNATGCVDLDRNSLERIQSYLCERHVGGRHQRNYIVSSKVHANNRYKVYYYCMQFEKRIFFNKNNVLAIAVYKTSKGIQLNLNTICTNSQFASATDDIWLWIPFHVQEGNAWSACPLRGGHQFTISWINRKMNNKVEDYPLCMNTRQAFSWMESECFIGEGLNIEFYPSGPTAARCNPFGIQKKTRFYCLGTWTQNVTVNDITRHYEYTIIYDPNDMYRVFTLRRSTDKEAELDSFRSSKSRLLSTMHVYEGPSEVKSSGQASTLLDQNRFLLRYRPSLKNKAECDDKLAICPSMSCFGDAANKLCYHTCGDFNSCMSKNLNTKCQFERNDQAIWTAIRTNADNGKHFKSKIQVLSANVKMNWEEETSQNITLSCFITKTKGLYLLSREFDNGCRRRQLCMQMYTPNTIMGMNLPNPVLRMIRFSQSKTNQGNMHCTFENDPLPVGDKYRSPDFVNYIKNNALDNKDPDQYFVTRRDKCGFFEDGPFTAQWKDVQAYGKENCTILLSDRSLDSREYGGVLQIDVYPSFRAVTNDYCMQPHTKSLRPAIGQHNCLGILRSNGDRIVEMIITQSQSIKKNIYCWIQYTTADSPKIIYGFNSSQCGLQFIGTKVDTSNYQLPHLLNVDNKNAFIKMQKLSDSDIQKTRYTTSYGHQNENYRKQADITDNSEKTIIRLTATNHVEKEFESSAPDIQSSSSKQETMFLLIVILCFQNLINYLMYTVELKKD